MSDTRAIGVFDSGIGGLTVAREMLERLPGEKIYYFGDTARYPYGPRSREAVRRMAGECVAYLHAKRIKMMVVACNTATAFAFDHLQSAFAPMPFVGVVEPCVTAVAEEFDRGTIGVIGTAGTISCGIYRHTLKTKAPRLSTLSAACPLLVPLAEEGILKGPILDHVLDLYLRPFKGKVRALILGCTHYPFFRKAIENYFKGRVRVLDSAIWTVRAVAETLLREGLVSGRRRVSMQEHRFMVTDLPEKFKRSGEFFLGRRLGNVEKVRL
jgi:glutamate racemase